MRQGLVYGAKKSELRVVAALPERVEEVGGGLVAGFDKLAVF